VYALLTQYSYVGLRPSSKNKNKNKNKKTAFGKHSRLPKRSDYFLNFRRWTYSKKKETMP
jgi:hypothetical protein